jgi:hypothetical protein
VVAREQGEKNDDDKYNSEGVRPIFWLSPGRIRPLQKSNEIHPANGLQAATVAALGGNGWQEAVTASN